MKKRIEVEGSDLLVGPSKGWNLIPKDQIWPLEDVFKNQKNLDFFSIFRIFFFTSGPHRTRLGAYRALNFQYVIALGIFYDMCKGKSSGPLV